MTHVEKTKEVLEVAAKTGNEIFVLAVAIKLIRTIAQLLDEEEAKTRSLKRRVEELNELIKQ